jgi:hypothetical protein
MNEYESERARARQLAKSASDAGRRSDRNVLLFHRDVLVSQARRVSKFTLFASHSDAVLFGEVNLKFAA